MHRIPYHLALRSAIPQIAEGAPLIMRCGQGECDVKGPWTKRLPPLTLMTGLMTAGIKKVHVNAHVNVFPYTAAIYYVTKSDFHKGFVDPFQSWKMRTFPLAKYHSQIPDDQFQSWTDLHQEAALPVNCTAIVTHWCKQLDSVGRLTSKYSVIVPGWTNTRCLLMK